MTSFTRPEVRSGDLRRWLPLVLVLVLLGVSAAVGQVSPSRNDSGVNLVYVGDGRAGPVLSPDDLVCERVGGLVSCTAEAVPLDLDIDYSDPHPAEPSTCTAVLAGQTVQCRTEMGDYGNASHTVFLTEVYDLLAGYEPSVPWWRTSNGLGTAILWLTVVLIAVFGVAAYALGGGQAWPEARRARMAFGMAALGMAAYFVMGQLVSGPSTAFMASWAAVHPFSVIGAALLGFWQWHLGGLAPGTRAARARAAVTAALLTGCYAFVFLIGLLLLAGVVD